MMSDFNDVQYARKPEQIRAWSVEQAIELFVIEAADADNFVEDERLISRAAAIEQFVLGKKEESDDGAE